MAKVIVAFKREGRLHCDACGHTDSHVSQFTPAIIGTTCPKCAADMMTLSDYIKTDKMYNGLAWLNRWFGPLFGKEESSADGEKVSIQIHDDDVHIKRNVKD